jgi:predicted phosphodiesterase
VAAEMWPLFLLLSLNFFNFYFIFEPIMKKQTTSRRSFLQQISFASLVLLSGEVKALSYSDFNLLKKKVKLRFVVASDAHYGQDKTPFEEYLQRSIQQINQFHQKSKLDFCVVNGDIIHNEKKWLPLAKAEMDAFQMPHYVTRGNHDMVSADYWQEVFSSPLNQVVEKKQVTLILGDTSNEKGQYLSSDLVWLKASLDQANTSKPILIFLHIPQKNWTKNAIQNKPFFDLISNYPNIKAVFHGHEHDQDGVKMFEKIPFLFDAHIGGNWGTDYRGFRVCELLNDGTLLTYMMNPTEKMNEMIF